MSVVRTFIPGDRCAVDKLWKKHSCVMQNHVVMLGDCCVTGVLTNQDAYQRWVRTTHTRYLSMADMLIPTDEAKHEDACPAEILKSEKHKKQLEAFSFHCRQIVKGSCWSFSLALWHPLGIGMMSPELRLRFLCPQTAGKESDYHQWWLSQSTHLQGARPPPFFLFFPFFSSFSPYVLFFPFFLLKPPINSFF